LFSSHVSSQNFCSFFITHFKWSFT
jgi:hypothetical protein